VFKKSTFAAAVGVTLANNSIAPVFAVALVHAVPLLVKTLPLVPGATATTLVGVMIPDSVAMFYSSDSVPNSFMYII
jgi:sorbitol-specific phosphotransferase system component IIBC